MRHRLQLLYLGTPHRRKDSADLLLASQPIRLGLIRPAYLIPLSHFHLTSSYPEPYT